MFGRIYVIFIRASILATLQLSITDKRCPGIEEIIETLSASDLKELDLFCCSESKILIAESNNSLIDKIIRNSTNLIPERKIHNLNKTFIDQDGMKLYSNDSKVFIEFDGISSEVPWEVLAWLPKKYSRLDSKFGHLFMLLFVNLVYDKFGFDGDKMTRLNALLHVPNDKCSEQTKERFAKIDEAFARRRKKYNEGVKERNRILALKKSGKHAE